MEENIVVPILEIREEFATCEICLDDFDDRVRTPRTLPCLHTFCCECLEKMWGAAAQGVKCPKCRKIWPVQGSIKSSFQQNNMLMHMVEYIGFKKKLGDVLCYQCPDNNKATVRCLDCEKYLCETCDRYHARFNETHKPVPLTELASSSQPFLKQKSMCSVHDDKKIDVYCKNEECRKAICTTCVLLSHKEHDICDLKEFCDANKKKISLSLEVLKKTSTLRTEYKSKLVEQNANLDQMQQQLMKELDEYSNKLVEKVEKSSKKLKSLIMKKVAKQKSMRDEQLALVDKLEDMKAEHVLYCRQALSFARDVEFVEMVESLENKGKSFMEDSPLPDLQVEKVVLDTKTFEKAEKSIGHISIVHNCRYDTVDLRCPVCRTPKPRCVSKCNTPKHTGTVLTTAIKDKDQQSLLDKFKPKPGRWECTGCYCRNEADVLKCPACQTLKPGVKQDEVSTQTEKISTGGGFQFGTFGRFTFGAKTTQPNKTKTVPVAEGKEMSFAHKFKPKPGSWECTGCYCRNDSNVLQCSVCRTLKQGIKKEDIEKKSQSQTEAILGEGCLQFRRGESEVNKPQSKDQPIDSLFKADKPETTTADSKGPLSSGGFNFGIQPKLADTKPEPVPKGYSCASVVLAHQKQNSTCDKFSFASATKTGGFNFGCVSVSAWEPSVPKGFSSVSEKPQSKDPVVTTSIKDIYQQCGTSGGFSSMSERPQSKDTVVTTGIKDKYQQCCTSGGFSFAVKTTQPKETKVAAAVNNKFSFADIFKPDTESWTCTGCYCKNDANVHQCLACQTLKSRTETNIQQKSQSQSGTTSGVFLQSGSTGGFTFCVGKPQMNVQPSNSLLKINKPETKTVDSKGSLSIEGFTSGTQLHNTHK